MNNFGSYFFSLIWLICFFYVNSSSQNGAFLLLLIVLVFFFLCSSLFGGLRLLRSWRFGFLGFEPKLLSPEVFHWIALRLDVSLIGAWLVATQALLVYFFDKQIKLQACLSFGINRFFDYFCLIVQLLALLLHLGFNQWPKAFLEKMYKIRLFKRPGIVKLD